MPAQGTKRQILSRRGTWRTYTTAEGLAVLQIEHIAEDPEGYLWFATWDNGVSRFDGDEFCTFTRKEGLCGNRVMAIHLDRQERLWFGTVDGGACWYEGRNFHCFEEGVLSSASIQSIYEDRGGRIWFGGSGVLGYWDGEAFLDLVPAYRRQFGRAPSAAWPLQCWGIAQDEGGDLWFGFDRLVRYDGGAFHQYGEEEGLASEKGGSDAQLAFYAVACGGGGELWVGRDNQIWRWEEGRFQPVPVELDAYVRKIQADREGRTWFCTTGGALCCDGEKFHRFTSRNGLPYDQVNSVLQDREHHIWIATWGGIACYDPHSIQVFGEDDGLPCGEMSALLEDRRGHLWMGFNLPPSASKQQAARYDGARFEILGRDQGFDLGRCLSLCEDQEGHLWFGGFRHLLRYDGRRFQCLDSDFEGVWITAMSTAPRGGMLFGHLTPAPSSAERRLQITCYDGQRFQALFRHPKEPLHYFSAIAATDAGELWFALETINDWGEGKGLGHWSEDEGVRFYTVAEGLVDDRVVDIVADRRGRLWMATLGGISCFDGTHFHNFTTGDGLPSNRVRCVCLDRQGNLWFGVDGGVVRYDGRTFQTIRSPFITSAHKIVQGRGGAFWFATKNNVIRYTPAHEPPRVRVVQTIADRVHQEASVETSTSTHQVIFEYKGTSFRTRSRDMLYTCRLRGCDNDWRPATRATRTIYQNLPPGAYTFEVRAIDRDLNESLPARISLRVAPDAREDRIEALEAVLRQPRGLEQFIGSSPALRRVQEQLATVAATDMTVLILGETGTGKGLAARALHEMSPRKQNPFIQVNCGAIPANLVESELFGHEKGAFTGAIARSIGSFELAEGGTLFLDEIGDLPPASQQVLLQVLQDGILQRVGGRKQIKVDVRVVAATNRDLHQAMREGQFREDLFYRLSVFVLPLPPLRERREDIPMLVSRFVEQFARHLNRPVPRVDPAAMIYLQQAPWPGNVRELEHQVQRAVLVCKEHTIRSEDLGGLVLAGPAPQAGGAVEGEMPLMSLEEVEKRLIKQALEMSNGIIYGERGAARLLDVHPEKLRWRMRKYGMQRPGGRGRKERE